MCERGWGQGTCGRACNRRGSYNGGRGGEARLILSSPGSVTFASVHTKPHTSSHFPSLPVTDEQEITLEVIHTLLPQNSSTLPPPLPVTDEQEVALQVVHSQLARSDLQGVRALAGGTGLVLGGGGRGRGRGRSGAGMRGSLRIALRRWSGGKYESPAPSPSNSPDASCLSHPSLQQSHRHGRGPSPPNDPPRPPLTGPTGIAEGPPWPAVLPVCSRHL